MRNRRTNGAFAALVASLLFGSMAGYAYVQQAGVEAGRGRPAGTPQKYALLVGIDHYRYPDRVPPLEGSLNDVEDVRQMLIGKFDFPPENILVLKDSQATHAAIIHEIQIHLIAKVHAGDIVVFHYSGHGSQMKDVTGKMISGLDETIVPYDSRDPEGKVFDISGAELHPLLVQLAGKTKNLTFILDSCHSGTLVRGARARGIAADTRTPPQLSPETLNATRGAGRIEGSAEPAFAFISAASSQESAFEYSAEGKEHGALTYFLARQMRASSGEATYRDIMDGVAGNVTAHYPAQHPSLEGAEPDQHVFGDRISLAHEYVGASPSSVDAHQVTLNVGQVEGATVGSTYDVYAPGSKTFAPPEKPTGRAQIVTVGDLTSEATLVTSGRILPASRAVEREHRYESQSMRLFIEGSKDSTTMQAIRAALLPLKYIEVVDNPTLCNLQLRQTANGIETRSADSTRLSPPVPINDPAAVERVLSQLKLWARWFNVLSIRNPESPIDLRFTLKTGAARDAMARIGRPDVGVTEGETLEATLTNNSERNAYVAILDLSSDGSISVIYPSQQGAEEVLIPGATLTRSFKAFVPEGRSNVTDILKAFASYQPINLTSLTQAQIRDIGDENAESEPLQQLLFDSTGGSRGLAPVLSKPLELNSWGTLERVLVVKRGP